MRREYSDPSVMSEQWFLHLDQKFMTMVWMPDMTCATHIVVQIEEEKLEMDPSTLFVGVGGNTYHFDRKTGRAHRIFP